MSLHNLVSLARADLICILDCDDKWESNKLMRQIETLDSLTSDTAVIGTFCKYFGDKTLELVLDSGYINPAILETYNPIINSSTMIKKEHCDLTHHRIHNTSAFNGTKRAVYKYLKYIRERSYLVFCRYCLLLK
jgi:hypothetical protein